MRSDWLCRRHTLVWIDPSVWSEVGAQQTQALPEEWASEHRPLVVRRRADIDSREGIPLGLPLPPDQGKRRLSLCVDASVIIDVQPMPALRLARECAPGGWQSAIDRILTAVPQARVFGSLAWQYLTGLRYLNDASDLDLLIDMPASQSGWRTLSEQLAAIGDTPLMIDGECVRADGAAVKWREFASHSAEILVWERDGVSLVPRATFLRETFTYE